MITDHLSPLPWTLSQNANDEKRNQPGKDSELLTPLPYVVMIKWYRQIWFKVVIFLMVFLKGEVRLTENKHRTALLICPTLLNYTALPNK